MMYNKHTIINLADLSSRIDINIFYIVLLWLLFFIFIAGLRWFIYSSRITTENLITLHGITTTNHNFVTNLKLKKINYWQNSIKHNNIQTSNYLELAWLVLPWFILLVIILAYLLLISNLLINLLPVPDGYSLYIIAKQWNWLYQFFYGKPNDFNFFSYSTESVNYRSGIDFIYLYNLSFNQLYHSFIYNYIILPIDNFISCSITSLDVIHSWALPVLGIKVDAVPGSFNRFNLILYNKSVYVGNCTELCGTYHAAMPFVLFASENQ